MDLFSFIGDTLRSIPTNDTAKMEQMIDLAEDKAKKGAMGAMGLTLGQDRVDNITGLAEQGNQMVADLMPEGASIQPKINGVNMGYGTGLGGGLLSGDIDYRTNAPTRMQAEFTAPNPMGIQNSQMSLQGSTTTANGVPNSFDNLMGNAQFQFKFTKRF
tara:strand:- start:1068 stop:1544 length:477 start_codon:yes stop_codon:yes gene_type:complete